jgi:hypothetical protein
MAKRGMSAAWMAKIRGMRKNHKSGKSKKYKKKGNRISKTLMLRGNSY